NLQNDTQVLIMKGNSVFNIPDDVSELHNLRELDMSGNRIKSLGRGGMFQKMSRLEYLNAGKNSISTIFHDSFKGSKALKILILSNNRVNYIEDEALIDLSALQVLDLEHNLMGSLYKEWFHGLGNLIILKLSHNRIHNIPASVFISLTSLSSLDLAGNRVSNVDPRAFSGLISLQELNMKDNLLSNIPTAAMKSLPTLDMLLLDQNPLIKIQSLAFSHLTASRISICHMPELIIIDAKAFYRLDNISIIDIADNNKLSYIDPYAFMNLDSLTELKLHKNNLQGIQKEIADYFPGGMKLSIYENPIRCDCNVIWLQRLIHQSNPKNITLLEPEHIVCHSPPKQAHKLLKDVNVSKIPKECIPNVLQLTQKYTISGKIGERKVLECRALGSPIPRMHWLMPDGAIVNSTLNEVTRRFSFPGTLVYFHLKPTDEGQYTCVAENEVGETNITFTLTVSEIDIHLFPIRASSTFVTLVWNGTERCAYPSYKITYTAVDDNETEIGETKSNTASSLRKSYTVSRLKPETRYKFCLGYGDNNGYWLQISCCFAKTLDIEFMFQGISRTSNVAVAAIIGIILVMTVVACLISVLSTRYRHRFYETPDKNTEGYVIPLNNLYRPLLTGS
ncbi:Leucine-rich repeat neuronal protein 1, partial [Halocaridina rubra]